jgi:alkylation response protein AidB-like acyl-CoA dehydrogenase
MGGLGVRGSRARIVAEELARVHAPTSSNPIGIGLVGPVLMRHGTDEQKRLLGRIASHEDIWCQLFSEPGSGSDLASLGTRAVRSGVDWVVDGQKVWSSLAHQAHLAILLARTNPEVEKHAGITAFILDMNLPGVEVRPLRLLTGDSHFNEVFLTEVRLADSMRLGEEGRGWEIARTTLAFEHSEGDPGQSVTGSAPGREINTIIERYAPVLDPWLHSRVIDAWIEDRVGRQLSARLRELRRQGAVPGADGSIEKIYHSEHRLRVQELLIDLGGEEAIAYSAENLWAERSEWAFLRTRTRTIAGGTSEIHRDKIAERLLGLPRDDPFKGVPWREIPRS